MHNDLKPAAENLPPPGPPSSTNPFASFVDIIKQVITLATGFLTVTITFGKDMVPADFTISRWMLAVAWTSMLLSMVTGGLAMMKASGLEQDAKADPTLVQDSFFVSMWRMQLGGFAVGIVLLFFLGLILLFSGPPPKAA